MHLTFEDIMNDDADNIEIYRNILKRYKDRGLVPFVGAGLSVPAGFPSWRAFLDIEKDDPSDPLDVASELSTKRGGEHLFQIDVANAFGGKFLPADWNRRASRVQNEAIGLLPKLFRGVVITTNFDRLLEHLYSGAVVAHPGEYSKLNRAVQMGTSAILKLHGCVLKPDSIILTRESYSQAYPDTDKKTDFIIALEKILTNQTVLFLGCSLKDDHTLKQWAKMLTQPEGEGIEHFAIVNCTKTEMPKKRADLGEMNIFPILYNHIRTDDDDKENHDAVRIILERLYRDTNGGQPLNNLPPKNPYFTGRENQLEGLQKTFDDMHAIRVVSGLGGVGKTQTVLEYAHRHLDGYGDGVWWLNAESELDLMQGCREVLIKVGVLDEVKASDIKPDELLNRWQYWLGEHRKRLLIFDNAESEIVVERYMSKKYCGHVLLTTRDASWGGEPTMGLPLMSESEAVEFLLKRTGRKEQQHTWAGVEDVAKRLGYLPLALEQAAAYMRNVEWSFSGYLDMLSGHGLSTLDKDYAKPDEKYYKKIVTTTWQISFDKIKRENNIVSELFNVFAYVDSNNIPLEVFVEHQELMFFVDLQKIDKLCIVDAVALLLRYSLIEREGKDDYLINIHRLVQEIVRDIHKNYADTSYVTCCFKVLYKAVPKNYDSERGTRPLFERVAKHALAATKYYENTCDNNATQKIVGEAYHFVGLGYIETTQFSTAIDVYNSAATVFEKVWGKEQPETASIYGNIAYTYEQQGKFDEALKWYMKALSIKEWMLGKKHQSTAITYNNIANVYQHQGNYSMATEWYEKALAAKEEAFGKEHPNTAITYNNIAITHSIQGDYDKALEWYDKALTILKRKPGKEHTETANTYTNIALVYSEQGRYVEALELCDKALTICESVLGKEHPNTAIKYGSIAYVYKQQGRFDEALKWYSKALTIFEKTLGKEHPETAATYCGIANLYEQQGKYFDAVGVYEEVKAIYEKVFGEKHQLTVSVQVHIARVIDKVRSC